MTVKIDEITVAANTVAGNQDITIPGFGLPQAFMLRMTGATDVLNPPTVLPTAHARFSLSFSDFTRQRCVHILSRDNLTTTDDSSGYEDAFVAQMFDVGGGFNIECHATATQITDGIRLNWPVGAVPLAGYQITVTLFSGFNNVYCGHVDMGDDLLQKSTVDPGFQGNLIIASNMGTRNSDGNDDQVNASICMGFAYDNETLIEQGCMSVRSRDNRATTQITNRRDDSYLLHLPVQTGGSASLWTLDNFTATGFNVTPSGFGAKDHYLNYLLFDLPSSVDAFVGEHDPPEIAGLISETQPGHKPQYVVMLPNRATVATATNGQPFDSFGMSAVAAGGQTGSNFSMRNSSSDSVTKAYYHTTIIKVPDGDGSGTSVVEAAFTQFLSDGFELDYTVESTRTATRFPFLSIEESALPPGQVVTVNSLTLASSITTITIDAAPPPGQTVNVNALTLTSSIATVTVTAGESPTIVTAQTLTLVSSTSGAAIQPGETLISANSLLLSSTIPIVVIQTIENQTVLAKSITLSSNTPAITVQPGGVSIIANSLTLGTFLIDINIIGAGIVQVNWLWLQSSAPGAAVVPGEVTLSMNTLSLASSVETISLDLATLVMMATLQLNASAEPLQIAPGATSLLMDTLSLSTLLQVVSIISGTIPTSKTVYAEFTDVSPDAEFSNTSPRIDFEET